MIEERLPVDLAKDSEAVSMVAMWAVVEEVADAQAQQVQEGR